MKRSYEINSSDICYGIREFNNYNILYAYTKDKNLVLACIPFNKSDDIATIVKDLKFNLDSHAKNTLCIPELRAKRMEIQTLLSS